jgi:hypothetical protein
MLLIDGICAHRCCSSRRRAGRSGLNSIRSTSGGASATMAAPASTSARFGRHANARRVLGDPADRALEDDHVGQGRGDPLGDLEGPAVDQPVLGAEEVVAIADGAHERQDAEQRDVGRGPCRHQVALDRAARIGRRDLRRRPRAKRLAVPLGGARMRPRRLEVELARHLDDPLQGAVVLLARGRVVERAAVRGRSPAVANADESPARGQRAVA